MTFSVDALLESLLATPPRLPSEAEVRRLCAAAKDALLKDSNAPAVPAPVSVVGDVHGQFFDLLELFRVGGMPPDTNYVFLGDLVDRGHDSVLCACLLAVLKIRWPERVWLVRGNHECRAITQTYGFYDEVLQKYGSPAVWNYFMDMFDYFSLACVIGDSVFGVHGGIGPNVAEIDGIRVLDRFKELPHDGPVADLVWSDPTNDSLKSDFSLSPRGAGYLFSAPATRKFLHMNGLDSIVRAHQLCQEGYQIHHDDLLVTVWSAPNYVYRCGNDAAILELSESLTRHFNIFGPAPIDSRGDPEFLLTPARRARLASLGSERPSYIPSDPRIAAIWHAMDDAEYFGMPVDDEWEASPLEDEADVGPGDHGVHGKGAVEAYFL